MGSTKGAVAADGNRSRIHHLPVIVRFLSLPPLFDLSSCPSQSFCRQFLTLTRAARGASSSSLLLPLSTDSFFLLAGAVFAAAGSAAAAALALAAAGGADAAAARASRGTSSESESDIAIEKEKEKEAPLVFFSRFSFVRKSNRELQSTTPERRL